MSKLPKYTDPEEIKQKFEEYLEYCKAGETWPHINKRGQLITEPQARPPSYKGFNLFLGFSKHNELDRYIERVNKDDSMEEIKKEEWRTIISRVKLEIDDKRDYLSEIGFIEGHIAKLDYAHRNNLSDKSSIEVDIGQKLREALSKSSDINDK